MFWKLCKHELKCSYRSFMILYAILLVTSICFSPNMGDVFGNIWATIYLIVVAAIFIMSFVVMIRNYQISMFERNGYLTHTLPISTTQLLAVKLFGGMFWLIASTLVFLLGLFLLALRTTGFDVLYITNSIKNLITLVSNWEFLFYMVYLLLLFLETLSLIYFAMNLAHSGFIYRYRAIVVILLVIVIDYVMGEAMQLLLSPFSPMFLFDGNNLTLSLSTGLALAAKSLVLGTLYFFGSRYVLEHRLEVE